MYLLNVGINTTQANQEPAHGGQLLHRTRVAWLHAANCRSRVGAMLHAGGAYSAVSFSNELYAREYGSGNRHAGGAHRVVSSSIFLQPHAPLFV
jgi:hypothetical protein